MMPGDLVLIDAVDLDIRIGKHRSAAKDVTAAAHQFTIQNATICTSVVT